ncbi:unnamed protein product, partial [Ectocarpus sp. 8 AP-2014]
QSVVVEVLLLYGAALSVVKAFFPRSPSDENVHRKTTRPRPRSVVNRQERALVVWNPPANAADVGAEPPALAPARETALVVWSPPTDLMFALGAGTSRYLRTLVFPSSGAANPFPRQTPISEITGLRMATHAHRPTPAVLLLGASQPSPWYPVRLATERCPLPIAPANSASCGEEDEELPTAAAQPVTGVSIVPNVVGQLKVDLVFPAVGTAVSASTGRRAATFSSSVLRSLESRRCDATAAVAGQQPRHSSTGSRGRTSVTGERRTRNSSRSRSPSPPPRSRGRPQSPLRSASPAPRPVAVGVFPYRPVAPSSPLAMENSAADDDLCAVFAMTTSPLIPPSATWPATG